MVRKFIQNNKSKIAIIISILIHSAVLFSTKSDKYLGKTNTPIEFTEIKVINGPGESISKNKSSQDIKKQSNTIEQNKGKKSDTKNSTNVISNISIKSKENKSKIQQIKEKKKNKKQQNNDLSSSKNASILGNKSKELEDEALKGKLKGKGKKTIICRKCIEPIYSQKSIRKGLEGITIIKVTIDKNGLVISAKVIDSSGHKDIDDASISAAMKSIFRPISEPSTITIKYEHKIK